MSCPECQREIPSDSLYCCYCGEPLQRCERCELFFLSTAAFCGGCGGQLLGKREPQFQPPEDPDDHVLAYLYEPGSPETLYPLEKGDNTVGAGGNNDIVIDRPAISWNHAILIFRNDKVLLQDSASTNGTFVNDTRVQQPCRVEHDNVIRFGGEEFRLWLMPSMRQSED